STTRVTRDRASPDCSGCSPRATRNPHRQKSLVLNSGAARTAGTIEISSILSGSTGASLTTGLIFLSHESSISCASERRISAFVTHMFENGLHEPRSYDRHESQHMKLDNVIAVLLLAVMGGIVAAVTVARQSWEEAEAQRRKDKVFAEVIIP